MRTFLCSSPRAEHKKKPHNDGILSNILSGSSLSYKSEGGRDTKGRLFDVDGRTRARRSIPALPAATTLQVGSWYPCKYSRRKYLLGGYFLYSINFRFADASAFGCSLSASAVYSSCSLSFAHYLATSSSRYRK